MFAYGAVRVVWLVDCHVSMKGSSGVGRLLCLLLSGITQLVNSLMGKQGQDRYGMEF